MKNHSRRSKASFANSGLPYVSDPAVTRHLADFLKSSPAAEHGVDAILFNGGFFIPQIFRDRVRDVVAALVRAHSADSRESGFRSGSRDWRGLLFLCARIRQRRVWCAAVCRALISWACKARRDAAAIKAVCLMPRGTEEGTEIKLEQPELQLVANTPVPFAFIVR